MMVRNAAILLLSLGLGISAQAFGGALGLDVGRYVGSGTWRSTDGESGTYEVEKSVGVNTVAIKYTYADRVAELRYELKDAGNGFFNWKGQNGGGVCIDDQCQYSVRKSLDDGSHMMLVESCARTRYGGLAIGTKTLIAADGTKKTIAWQERLVKID